MKTSFSNLERKIAAQLGVFPQLKKCLKHIYSIIIYVGRKKKYTYTSEYIIKPVLNNLNDEYFFGYYDKSPANQKDLIIFHKSKTHTNHIPPKNTSVTISIVSNQTQKELFILESNAYNWQQGSRTHWLNNDLLVFNDYSIKNNRYEAIVFSLPEQKKINRYAYPVQDSFKHDYFLSINYRRLLTLQPDYGYRRLPPMKKSEILNIKNDGIWKIDFKTGNSTLLISLAQICNIEPRHEFLKAKHFVNHVMISPSGNKFIFIHRYIIKNKRYDRLLLSSSNGREVKLLADYGMVSHCFWINDSHIISYLKGPKKENAYWIIDINNTKYKKFANGVLDKYGDGHPHVHDEWLVTDTYPDKARIQYLLLANLKSGKITKLGEFYHGLKYRNENRCDLHPRFSPDGKSVFIDSVFSGRRKLYRLFLTDNK
ncbi:MAG: hypothetical protein ACP5E3_02225 [Bacteroidales bacterium]